MNDKSKAMTTVEEPNTVMVQDNSPATMMLAAKAAGMDAAEMKEMLEVQKSWEANEARKAYHLAVAAFKAEEVCIIKDKKVGFNSNDGQSRTEYSHASLANIVETTVPFLSKHGLSHSWHTSQAEGGVITVTCTLTHELGHSESTSLQSSPDNSGKKNTIQAIASAITYLERYTFLAITGLATRDMEEDDGKAAGVLDKVEYITEEQSNELHSKITINEINMDSIMKWLGKIFPGIESIDQVQAKYFDRVNKKIDETIKKKKEISE